MWPFTKKETPAESLGRDLGLQTDRLGLDTRPPVNESYDQLTPKGMEAPSIGSSYDAPKTMLPPQMAPQNNNDLQVISAKLDTIKAMLDMLNARIATLERNVEGQNKQKLW
jgi:hypothetical protein